MGIGTWKLPKAPEPYIQEAEYEEVPTVHLIEGPAILPQDDDLMEKIVRDCMKALMEHAHTHELPPNIAFSLGVVLGRLGKFMDEINALQSDPD
jgi:hypothetical protein